jgi:hypothetical protein
MKKVTTIKPYIKEMNLKTNTGNLFLIFITSLFISLASCEKNDYTIDYQQGYPNFLAGNWWAVELQNAEVVNNRVISFDNISDPFDLVSALDPNSEDSLVFDNIYDSNIRVKVHFDDSTFSVVKGRQLEVINYGQYGIYYVSVEGKYNDDEENRDYLTMHIGLYDKYSALYDTMFVIAARKTGFEDTEYQSLLSD